MSDTYNNVPMSEDEAEAVVAADAAWTGPKLIILSFVVLGAAFALLWAASEGIIGPQHNEVDWGQEEHLLQSGCVARPWD